MFKDKNVLVTGSEGMIGRELVEMLEARGARVKKADLRLGHDLIYFDKCLEICKGIEIVFHLAGIKGNPKMTAERPADFFVPMVQFNTNMLEAARLSGVKSFLYTSSIAVLNPETDEYPAWAKMTGEKQIEAYRIQYPDGMKCCIVRPANVYGRYDNFEAKHAMVITDLIRKAVTGKLEVWGDGSQVRDFVNAKDVALGMIIVMEKMPQEPINLGSGKEYSIKEIVEIIAKELSAEVTYDTTKPSGGQKRVMDISKAQNLGFEPQISIEKGILEMVEYYKKTHQKT
ncbi:NAD-dependent epimerase/dehydratase family protein [Candidatus Pacearchaeota archaeon]|nr:NAD-dependent epimerase/dehydratase family protein [Candidatus Pacearchaeota archaeon]